MDRIRPALQVATIAGLLLLIAVLDRATGLFHLTVLFAVPVILATAAFGIVGGLITVAAAVISVATTHTLLHSPTVIADVVTDLVLFLFAAFSVDRLRSQLRTIRELESVRDFDLAIARDVQQHVLRDVPQDARFDTAMVLDFVREVGGDYYRFHDLGGRLGVFAADISGKGMAAALFSMLLDEALGDALVEAGSLAHVADAVNRRPHESLPADMFVTMLFVALDENGIQYVNAGHVQPLFYRSASGEVAELAADGNAPLGVVPGSEAVAAHAPAEPGDVLLICSDGVTESPSLRDRPDLIASTLADTAPQGPRVVVERLRKVAESRGQTDDVTIICVSWR